MTESSFSFSIPNPVQTKPNDASIVPVEGKSREVQGKGMSSKLQTSGLLLASLWVFFSSSVLEEKTANVDEQVETEWPE